MRTNASGLARLAALLPEGLAEALLLPDGLPDVVDLVVSVVVVKVALLKVELPVLEMPDEAPVPVPRMIEVVALSGIAEIAVVVIAAVLFFDAVRDNVVDTGVTVMVADLEADVADPELVTETLDEERAEETEEAEEIDEAEETDETDEAEVAEEAEEAEVAEVAEVAEDAEPPVRVIKPE